MYCEKCGAPIHPGATYCEHCGHVLSASNPPASKQQKRENAVTGTVGALIGALIGAGAIVLASRLGIMASICGFILAIATLKGYELLGGKMSTKGIVICIVLMLVMPYLADRIDWAIIVSQEWNVDFSRAFSAIPDLYSEGSLTNYSSNLAMLYLFTALGAVGTIVSAFKNKKK